MNNKKLDVLLMYLDTPYSIIDGIVYIGQDKQSPMQFFDGLTDRTARLKDGRMYAVLAIGEEMPLKADLTSLKYLDKFGGFLILELSQKTKKTSTEKMVEQTKKGFEKTLKLIEKLGNKVLLLPQSDVSHQVGQLEMEGDKFTYTIGQLGLPDLDINKFAVGAVFNIHFSSGLMCAHNRYVFLTNKTDILFDGKTVSLPWKVATLLCNLDKSVEVEFTFGQDYTSVYIPCIDVSFKEKTYENDLKMIGVYKEAMFEKYIPQFVNPVFSSSFELKIYNENKDAKLVFKPNTNDSKTIDVNSKLYADSEYVGHLVCKDTQNWTEPLGLDNSQIEHMIKFLGLDKNDCLVEFAYCPSLSTFRAVRGDKAAYSVRSRVD